MREQSNTINEPATLKKNKVGHDIKNIDTQFRCLLSKTCSTVLPFATTVFLWL